MPSWRSQGTKKWSRRITARYRYSEETFTRIADGRLPRGWDDQAAIDIVIGVARKAPAHAHAHANAATPKAADCLKHAANVKNAKASMGAPCGPWNRNPVACDKARRASPTAPPPTDSPMHAVTALTCAG